MRTIIARRGSKCRPNGEPEKRGGVPLSLMILVDRKLTEQRHCYGIGFVALLRSGQERAFDLRRAQAYVADDLACNGIANKGYERCLLPGWSRHGVRTIDSMRAVRNQTGCNRRFRQAG